MEATVKTYKLLCEYRFKPILLFYDVKNQIGHALFKDYKHWSHDGLRVNLNNFQNRSVLAIDHNRLALEFDIPDSYDEFRSDFERAFKEYTKRVKIEKYLRFGLRTQSMIPVEMHFSELTKITEGKFLSHEKELLQIVGNQADDYQYNVVSERERFKIHLICGPVAKEEIGRWYQPANLNLDPGQEPKPIKYPDVAFFIDCDCYVENPDSDMRENFLDRAMRLITSINNGVNEYIWR
ncbi:MAG: TIGR04255 family protein [Nitrospirota bacterium]